MEHVQDPNSGRGNRPESGEAIPISIVKLDQDLKEVLKNNELQFPVDISFGFFIMVGRQILWVWWQIHAFFLVKQVCDQGSDSKSKGGSYRIEAAAAKGAYNFIEER